MTLFQTGDFTLASGAKSTWKIECDALTPEDWAGLAAMAAQTLPPFGAVVGVPRGGVPFADALRKYATAGPLLIAEDVCTTGGSMERFKKNPGLFLKYGVQYTPYAGVCVFARGTPPPWVTPLFTFGPAAG